MPESDQKPLIVTVSGTTNGPSRIPIRTPFGQRDIIVKVITPLTIISVRAARTFLQTLLGMLTVGAVSPSTLGASDFAHSLWTCAGLSVASMAICIIQNLIELLAKFDQSHPTLTS